MERTLPFGHIALAGAALAAAMLGAVPAAAQTCRSISATDTSVTESFDSLSRSGTSTVLPTGWFMSDDAYNADNGSLSAVDLYSYGATASTERALGSLRGGTFGACFTNDTGVGLDTIRVTYYGEQWRLGAEGRQDEMYFDYSLDATSLDSGSWSFVSQLSFSSLVTTGTVGPLDGNANRGTVSTILGPFGVGIGSTFWIRFRDFDASGEDDGLAVDDLEVIGYEPYNCRSLTSIGTAVTESFDSLATSGTSSTLPTGWRLSESGTSANTTYTAENGSTVTGDTYSFGSDADRALGTLLTGSLASTVGACFQNNTGVALQSVRISYRGEQWRLGTADRTDRLDFQTRVSALDLSDLSWIDHDGLDVITADSSGSAGSRDGNTVYMELAAEVTVAVPNGATFWVRWVDADASGSDDGLAIDDFSITPRSTARVDLVAFTATRVPGGVQLAWQTGSEIDCGAFTVARCDRRTGACDRHDDHVELDGIRVPCRDSALGGSYDALDASAVPAGAYSYLLLEHETTGGVRTYGPVVVAAAAPPAGSDAEAAPDGEPTAAPSAPAAATPAGTGRPMAGQGCAASAGGGEAPALLPLFLLVTLRRRNRRV